MCGIAGELRLDGGPVDRALVRAMTRALSHRGPDGEGYHTEPGIGLGHTRLAIVDEANGGQPLSNEDGTVWLVCNGQIDNAPALERGLHARGHRFRTGSDNEAVLHLYEEDPDGFVDRLEGMYALALWDARRRRMVLLRDPFGIKPLYYTITTQAIRFASEPKALLLAPNQDRTPDPLALRDCLLNLAVDDRRTAYRNVARLPAGHQLVIENGAARLSRYYDPPRARSPREAGSRADAARELRRRLDACVGQSLRADRPLGVFLSGGLDSSAIVALASRHAPGLPTFSARILSPGFDESGHSRLVASRFHTAHHELTVTAADASRALPVLLSALDEPFADASLLPTFLLSRFAREHVKAVLGGEGMDELHGGNFWHRNPRLAQGALNAWPGEGAFGLGSIVTPEFADACGPFDMSSPEPRMGEREQRLRRDLTGYLPSDLLRKIDTAGMLASLETRVPALNRFFADHATSLPVSWRVDGRQGKKLLRLAFRDILPASILRRPKRGFAIPMDAWLWEPGPFREEVRDLLHSRPFRARGLWRPGAVERLWKQHDRLEALHGYRLWSLFVIEAWHRRYVDRPPAPR